MINRPNLSVLRQINVKLFKLTTESHMAVGAGEAVLDLRPVDKPIIRALIYDNTTEGKRIAYIPASSLHGVWRAWVEKALRSKSKPVSQDAMTTAFNDLKNNTQYDEPFKKELCKDLGAEMAEDQMSPAQLASQCVQHLLFHPDVCDLFSETDRCEALDLPAVDTPRKPLAAAKSWWSTKLVLERPCKVCKLFGHTGQRGRVRFTPAYPAMNAPETLPVDIITRVAINRITGAADDGKLFDLEAVPPQVPFYFFALLENLENQESEIFDYGFKALNLNLATLGAHGSVGFGAVRLENYCSIVIDKQIFDQSIEDLNIKKVEKEGFSLPDGFNATYYPTFLSLLTMQKKQDGRYALAELKGVRYNDKQRA